MPNTMVPMRVVTVRYWVSEERVRCSVQQAVGFETVIAVEA